MIQYAGRVLIVDDDVSVCKVYEAVLDKAGFYAASANNLTGLYEALKSFSYDVVLLDLQLGQEEGINGLPLILREQPFAKIYILTSHGSIERAVECMRRGASGFFEKTGDYDYLINEIKATITPKPGLKDASDDGLSLVGLIGDSAAIQETIATIKKIRNVDSTVLILGESGTGKEVVARAIHKSSLRHAERFEAINCGAIPETLLESELFGHKKGSFTDAKTDRKGIFEVCTNGTLLLDEIGDMPFSLQTKLLRVLQERQITPVGSNTAININTRVIAATHRDIQDECRSKRFREDLFYRLSVVVLHIPALRHRIEDVPKLAEYFLEQFNNRFSKHVRMPDNRLMARMMAYDWPGNVRELQNSIERAVVLSIDDQLSLENIFQHLDTSSRRSNDKTWDFSTAFSLPLTDAKHFFEKVYLENLLTVSGGNISEAARVCGRYRADIYRLMDRYGFDQATFR
jgi:DNA-binding NtrC family response regulator